MGEVTPLLDDLIPDLAMVAPVERVTDEEHGEGLSLQLGTKTAGQTGRIRLFPDKRQRLGKSHLVELRLPGA